MAKRRNLKDMKILLKRAKILRGLAAFRHIFISAKLKSADDSSKAWIVNFRNDNDNWNDVSNRNFVRCVRE